MRVFQDILITDLKEEKTSRNPQKDHLMDYCFGLSDEAPSEWREILRENLIRHKTARKALVEASHIDENTFRHFPDVFERQLGSYSYMESKDELKWTARERDLEKHFKVLEKCINETNTQYASLVQQRLKQQERDRSNTSSLRERLFGKENR